MDIETSIGRGKDLIFISIKNLILDCRPLIFRSIRSYSAGSSFWSMRCVDLETPVPRVKSSFEVERCSWHHVQSKDNWARHSVYFNQNKFRGMFS